MATYWGRGTAATARLSREMARDSRFRAASTECEAVESGCVSGDMGERDAELPLRARVVASREEKLPELQRRPGRRFGAGHGGLGCQPHGGDGAGTVAEQLSRVRDAGVRRRGPA